PISLLACSPRSSVDDTPGDLDSASDDTSSSGDGFNLDTDLNPFDALPDSVPSGPCKNLQCKQVTCPSGGSTTVSGTVYAPTPDVFGPADPLYNVIVYVPNATPDPFKPGVTCDKCGAL